MDDFLHENRNAGSLEAIRDDLGLYLKVLRSSMIELINEDYADFVNLSANLIGLDQSIRKIQKPLEVLREEVMDVQQTLKMAMDDIVDGLREKKQIRSERNKIKCYEDYEKSLNKLSKLLTIGTSAEYDEENNVLLERMALQTIQISFNQKFCGDMITDAQRDEFQRLHRQLLTNLKRFFLDSLVGDEGQDDANEKRLDRCLKIYANIDEVATVEEIIRTEVLEPPLDRIITDTTIQKRPERLADIYGEILAVADTHLKVLLRLTSGGPLENYAILLNCFWTEVERRLGMNMSSIFAPGNPEQFYGKYQATLAFLGGIEARLDGESAIQRFRDSESYKKFQNRWNLPVYFQIRFQELGSAVESVCTKTTVSPIRDSVASTEFTLNQFTTAWRSIERCWSDGIYLTQLFIKFWKLTLQILARLSAWIEAALKSPDFEASGVTKVGFFVAVYADTVLLQSKLPEILAAAKRDINAVPHETLLDTCLADTRQTLNDRLSAIEAVFQQELLDACQPHIKYANDIPRLFRKTNKDVPTRPCAYVEHMVAPLRAFRSSYAVRIGPAQIDVFYRRVCSNLTVQFAAVVEDVLVSVQKTEESLRRLKNLREKSASVAAVTSSSTISDDDKIRTQLLVDVTSWRREIEKLGINPADVEKLADLISLVDGAASKTRI